MVTAATKLTTNTSFATMAATRGRSVTFADDERIDESDDDDCDDFFGEPSDDEDDEADGMRANEDLSLLEQLLNKHDADKGLSPSDWKDVELGNIQVTVGEATESVFEQFCEEEEFIRMAFQRSLGTDLPELHQIVDYFFGPDSKMFLVFKENISIDHNQFAKFIKTFCVQSAYKLSARQMFDKNSCFDTSSLCSQQEYKVIWQCLGSACLPRDERASPDSHDTLWMLLEHALNRAMKTLLLEVMISGENDDGRKMSELHVVCDDDKMPWEGKTNFAFLQGSRHV
jgi:hypothetical protein